MGGAVNEGFEKSASSLKVSEIMDERDTGEIEDFDQLLEVVGSVGKYQKFYLYAVLAPLTALMPFFSLSNIFILSEPDHWCHVPGRNHSSIEEWKKLTIPLETDSDGKLRYSKCSMYSENRTIMECQYGWDYDKTNYEFTLPSQYDWVCDKSHYATTAFTMQTVGSVFGVIVFGYLADRIGRKPVFFITVAVDIIFRTIGLFFAHNYTIYLICQVLHYTAFPLLYIEPPIIGAEISGKDYRGWIYGYTWMIWVIGMGSLPLAAWLSGTWFKLGIVASISSALNFLSYPFVPESPRWLLTMGRIDEAAKIMESIAIKNGRSNLVQLEKITKTLKYLHGKENRQREKQKRVGLWTLFSKPRLARNTIMLGICWSVNKLAYYGITLNASHLVGNEFLIFFILAITEVPSGYIGGTLVEKIGRRWTSVIFFLIGAITCSSAILGLGGSERSFITIACIVGSKFAITLTFFVVYIQGAEIFPTPLRSTGSSFASLVATVINVGAPYMVYTGKMNASLPYLIMGAACLIGLVAASLIPETLNRNLPETVDEGNDLGRYDKFWSIRPNEQSRSLRKRNDVNNKTYNL